MDTPSQALVERPLWARLSRNFGRRSQRRRERGLRMSCRGKSSAQFSGLRVLQELDVPFGAALEAPLQSVPPHNTPRGALGLDQSQLTMQSSAMSVSSTGSGKGASPRAAIWALRFSADGRYLAGGTRTGVVYVWTSAVHSRQSHSNSSARLSRWQHPSLEPVDGNVAAEGSDGLFNSWPLRMYTDHGADVLDIAWSPLNFIVSASMDKTARLYHVSKPGCLCVFEHPDAVSSVTFHPNDARMFVTGCLDGGVRVWVAGEDQVCHWYTVRPADMVTAISYSADGQLVVAGTLGGFLHFLDAATLDYLTVVAPHESWRVQLSRASRRAQASNGRPGVWRRLLHWMRRRSDSGAVAANSEAEEDPAESSDAAQAPSPPEASSEVQVGRTRSKICGIEPMFVPQQLATLLNVASAPTVGADTGLLQRNGAHSHGTMDDVSFRTLRAAHIVPTFNVLVSSNDSALRLCDTRDKSVLSKVEGHVNRHSQIRASFSHDAVYIISGSEDGSVYIWNALPAAMAKPSLVAGRTLGLGGNVRDLTTAVTARLFAPRSDVPAADSAARSVAHGSVSPEPGDSGTSLAVYPQRPKAGRAFGLHGFERVGNLSRRAIISAVFAPHALEVVWADQVAVQRIANRLTGPSLVEARVRNPAAGRIIAAGDASGRVFVLVNPY